MSPKLLEILMKSVRRSKAVATILAAAAIGSALLMKPLVGVAADAPLDSAVPTSQPAPTPTEPRDVQVIIADFQNVSKQLNSVMPAKVIADPAARNDAAPKAIPVIYHRIQLIDELAATKKIPPAQISQIKQNDQTLLYLLNDAPTVTKVKGMIDSKETARQIEGQSIDLQARWMANSADPVESKKLVDELDKLDRAHPDSTRLTMVTMAMAQSAHSKETSDQLQSLILDVKTDPMAKQMKAQLTAQKDAAAKMKALEGKPMEVAGKTVEGKDFTSADYKGKVVMVDFWATWCGPCKAGLPHVKEIYSQYHDKGLEIVGVSNDYTAKALQDFTPANDMPWVQLFDADAAGNHKWNPITLGYGVNGIPCMFLIDKKGICRSITARADMDELIPKLLAE
jgi:thiol-disulfide isomerase/thioredoxin